jgi:hypothetical protein
MLLVSRNPCIDMEENINHRLGMENGSQAYINGQGHQKYQMVELREKGTNDKEKPRLNDGRKSIRWKIKTIFQEVGSRKWSIVGARSFDDDERLTTTIKYQGLIRAIDRCKGEIKSQPI